MKRDTKTLSLRLEVGPIPTEKQDIFIEMINPYNGVFLLGLLKAETRHGSSCYWGHS